MKRSVETPDTGKHFDGFILDDVTDKPLSSKKVKEWYKKNGEEKSIINNKKGAKKDKPKVKKKKKRTVASLKKQLQGLTNLYCRIRDAYFEDGEWWVDCISCDKKIPWAKSVGGHFFAKGTYPSVRFLKWNIHGQCDPCNRYQHGALISYTLKMQEDYSRVMIDIFFQMARAEYKQHNREQLVELISVAKQELAIILAQKPVYGNGAAVPDKSLREAA